MIWSTVALLAPALLFITSIQAAPQIDVKPTEDDFPQWARNKVFTAIDLLKQAEQKFKDEISSAVENHREELNAEYISALMEYHQHRDSIHEECFQQGLTKLEAIKPDHQLLPINAMELLEQSSNNNYEMLNLAAVTTTSTPAPPSCVMAAIEDAGLMVYSVAKYIGQILITLDDVLNGYTLCSQGSIWRHFTCVFTYIATATSDIYQSLAGIGNLITQLETFAADIKQQITNCNQPKKFEIRRQLLTALSDADSCTASKYLH